MCLRVTGPLKAMKCPSSEPVSEWYPTPLFNHLGEDVVAQVDLVVRHHPDELKDLLPAGDEAWAQHVVHAEGLRRRGGRRGGVVRVRKLLAQLQVVQNEPVAVVGNAQTVRYRWRWQSWSCTFHGARSALALLRRPLGAIVPSARSALQVPARHWHPHGAAQHRGACACSALCPLGTS